MRQASFLMTRASGVVALEAIAMSLFLSIGITQCYLPREFRLYPQPKQVLDLATSEGCKAELTYVT